VKENDSRKKMMLTPWQKKITKKSESKKKRREEFGGKKKPYNYYIMNIKILERRSKVNKDHKYQKSGFREETT